MEKCKYCYYVKLVKNGFARGMQRYRCNHCGKNQIAADDREKYGNAVRRQALAMNMHSSGARTIGRMLKVPPQTVAGWLKNKDKIIEREIRNMQCAPQQISVLEKEKLPTYLQKMSGKHEYGWLWVGSEMKLLRLRKPLVAARVSN